MLSTEERENVLLELNSAKNKVAICFSGQLRTWRKCVSNWHYILKTIGYPEENIDVFCHIWDFNSIPNSIDTNGIFDRKVSKEEINEVLSILKPKKYVIESERVFTPFSPTQPITNSGFLSQFYGIMKSANLKRQYEIENNMRYSAVARSRYDTLYTDTCVGLYHNITPNVIKTCGIVWDETEMKGRIQDLFWVADSDTYDIIADYYINLGFIEKSIFTKEEHQFYPPELVFFYYLKKNNITIESNTWILKVMRESMELSSAKREGGYEVW